MAIKNGYKNSGNANIASPLQITGLLSLLRHTTTLTSTSADATTGVHNYCICNVHDRRSFQFLLLNWDFPCIIRHRKPFVNRVCIFLINGV